MALHILGLGWALAKNELDNEFLHKEVGLERGPDWVDSRIGIDRRFSVLPRDYIRQTKNADPARAVALARRGRDAGGLGSRGRAHGSGPRRSRTGEDRLGDRQRRHPL